MVFLDHEESCCLSSSPLLILSQSELQKLYFLGRQSAGLFVNGLGAVQKLRNLLGGGRGVSKDYVRITGGGGSKRLRNLKKLKISGFSYGNW